MSQLECTIFGCPQKDKPEYLMVDKITGESRQALCRAHGDDARKQGIANYDIIKMPDANSNKDRPLVTKPQPADWGPLVEQARNRETNGPTQGGGAAREATSGPTHVRPSVGAQPEATKGVTPMAEMASPDAIYDANEDWDEDPPNPNSPPISPPTNSKGTDMQQEEEPTPTHSYRRDMDEHMSSNFRVQLGNEQVFDIQITLRGGYSPQEFDTWFASLKHSIARVVQMGGRSVFMKAPAGISATATPAPTADKAPEASSGAPPPSPPVGKAATPTSAPSPSRTQTTPPQALTPGATGEFIARKMEVLPQPKGTTTVKFYTAGAQKPAYSFTRKPINLMPYFDDCGNAWNIDHFEKAGEWDVSYLVKWVVTDSPLPNKDGYYRDITSLTPAG